MRDRVHEKKTVLLINIWQDMNHYLSESFSETSVSLHTLYNPNSFATDPRTWRPEPSRCRSLCFASGVTNPGSGGGSGLRPGRDLSTQTSTRTSPHWGVSGPHPDKDPVGVRSSRRLTNPLFTFLWTSRHLVSVHKDSLEFVRPVQDLLETGLDLLRDKKNCDGMMKSKEVLRL